MKAPSHGLLTTVDDTTFAIPQDPVLAEIMEPIHELSERRGEWTADNAAYQKLNEALGKVMMAMQAIGDSSQRPWVAVHLAFAMGYILDVAEHYHLNMEGAMMSTHRSRLQETFSHRNHSQSKKQLTTCAKIFSPAD